ncbi:MAG: 2Fe-2S iron-sulfur cluster-binding protein [Chitinophagaceae bacterium]
MYSLLVNFEHHDPVIIQDVAPGATLLEVIIDNKIPLNHECGGICNCATCHIYIEKGNGHLEEMFRREKDFLQKASGVKNNSRLACQCLLLPGHGKIEITIPVQS